MTQKQTAAGQAKWTKTYKQRQAERGLAQIQIWIPEKDIARAKRYAEKLRKAHAKSSG